MGFIYAQLFVIGTSVLLVRNALANSKGWSAGGTGSWDPSGGANAAWNPGNGQKGPLGGWDDEAGGGWPGGNNVKGQDQPGDQKRWKLEDSIPGIPGQSYPNYKTVPETSFDCKRQRNPGYYGDVESKCQVFHICQADGRQNSFLCPIGTIFNQKTFVCDWWFNVNCAETPIHYVLNENLYKTGLDHGIGGSRGDSSIGSQQPVVGTPSWEPQVNSKGGDWQKPGGVQGDNRGGNQGGLFGDRGLGGNAKGSGSAEQGGRRQENGWGGKDGHSAGSHGNSWSSKGSHGRASGESQGGHSVGNHGNSWAQKGSQGGQSGGNRGNPWGQMGSQGRNLGGPSGGNPGNPWDQKGSQGGHLGGSQGSPPGSNPRNPWGQKGSLGGHMGGSPVDTSFGLRGGPSSGLKGVPLAELTNNHRRGWAGGQTGHRGANVPDGMGQSPHNRDSTRVGEFPGRQSGAKGDRAGRRPNNRGARRRGTGSRRHQGSNFKGYSTQTQQSWSATGGNTVSGNDLGEAGGRWDQPNQNNNRNLWPQSDQSPKHNSHGGSMNVQGGFKGHGGQYDSTEVVSGNWENSQSGFSHETSGHFEQGTNWNNVQGNGISGDHQSNKWSGESTGSEAWNNGGNKGGHFGVTGPHNQGSNLQDMNQGNVKGDPAENWNQGGVAQGNWKGDPIEGNWSGQGMNWNDAIQDGGDYEYNGSEDEQSGIKGGW